MELWHGKVDRATEWFSEVGEADAEPLGSYPKPKALERAGYDFPRYLERNGHIMRDDGERRRAGQVSPPPSPGL